MSALLYFYPGHQVMALAAIIAVSVTVTSVAGWAGSLYCRHRPELRYMALLAALVSACASPLLTLAFVLSGASLFSTGKDSPVRVA